MRLGTATIGAMGLFGTTVEALSDDDRRLGQALADVASVRIVQDRSASDRDSLNAQLQTAVDSRIAIEQAKGILAQPGELETNDAFSLLRKYSRDHNERLSDVARNLTSRQLDAQRILDSGRERNRRGPSR